MRAVVISLVTGFGLGPGVLDAEGVGDPLVRGTEFFDIDKSRSIPPQRRPEASRLLAALADSGRGFEAVVAGEPQRAFYGNQFGNTFPLFAHYRVPLWVPEVVGPVDPDNEAHDPIMSVFGGVSKGERNRIKIRVRTAMAAQAQIEGRFLGGRPPYGHKLVDVGPHPNPAKAADGKRAAQAGHRPARSRSRRHDLLLLPGRPRFLGHRRETDRRRHPEPVRPRPQAQPAPLRPGLVTQRRPRNPDQLARPRAHRPVPRLRRVAAGMVCPWRHRGPADTGRQRSGRCRSVVAW